MNDKRPADEITAGSPTEREQAERIALLEEVIDDLQKTIERLEQMLKSKLPPS
jgi:hypothetical protein